MGTRRFWLLAVIAVCATVATSVASLEITAAEVDAAAERAMESLRRRRETDIERARTKRDTEGAAVAQAAGCPFASQRHLHSRRATKTAVENAKLAKVFEETTRELMRSFEGTAEEARQQVETLQAVDISGTTLAATCTYPPVTCNPSYPYRSPEGICNNLKNPYWGSERACMRRFLSPMYADGVGSPRVAKSGHPLPNARKVSYTVHPDVNNPAVNFTHNVMQIGQFIDHDFALAPFDPTVGEIINLGNPNNPVDCCSASTRNTAACYSIDVPSGDPFFSQYNQKCINMPRSAPCTSCNLGYREQFDVLTSYIDGSQIYGSTQNDTMRLRLLQGGLLRYQYVGQTELLPRSFYPTMDRCSNPGQGQYCFRAGDERANEHPALTSTHTVWLRQHNLLADTLRSLAQPTPNDEQLFQTVKRIVESQFAHIVYSEWLPLILGPTIMTKYSLTPKTSGYTTYDATLDATMINEVAAAAFRLGHTLIDGKFFLDTSQGNSGSFDLKENYFFPFNLYNGQLDYILRGLLRQPAQNYDSFVTTGVTNHLYRLRNETFGLDLIALNLQRGRDHGLRPYTDYLKYCTGVTVKTFDDLKPFVRQAAIDQYKQLYEDVTDIDLFTAGISEYPVSGGIIGPTFACILGNMFNRLKYGDRFFYEHGNQAGSFSAAQLKEIRKTTYARILCDNSDAIYSIPLNVFKPPGTGNPTTNCQYIPQTDLRYWV